MIFIKLLCISFMLVNSFSLRTSIFISDIFIMQTDVNLFITIYYTENFYPENFVKLYTRKIDDFNRSMKNIGS